MESIRERAHTAAKSYKELTEDSEWYIDEADFCSDCKCSVLLDNRPMFNVFWCRGAHALADSLVMCIEHYEQL